MLNGIAPILIFQFAPGQISDANFFSQAISKIPLIGSSIVQDFGIPIPIYMDERLTGIVIDEDSKQIDVDTEVKQTYDGSPAKVTQRGLTNSVTINMIGKKDSIVLSTLIALNDQIFKKLVSKQYKIQYMNGPTTIFNGLLGSFSHTNSPDTDKINISMQIVKPNEQSTAEQKTIPIIQPIQGATPAGGV